MTNTLDWPGQSGSAYRYWFLASLNADAIKAEPGNYVFVKRLPNGNYLPLYFGQADDLKARLSNHERWGDAKKAGVTHVLAHTQSAGEKVRLDEERDLIQRWKPEMNTHHKKVS